MPNVIPVTPAGVDKTAMYGQSGKSPDKPVEESDQRTQTPEVSDGDKEPTGEDPRNCNFFGCA